MFLSARSWPESVVGILGVSTTSPKIFVRESAASLSPDSKARILTDLIKMSGALKDESERRVVELSPGQLDWLLEGDKETEEALARLGPSPNRR